MFVLYILHQATNIMLELQVKNLVKGGEMDLDIILRNISIMQFRNMDGITSIMRLLQVI